MTAPKMVIDWGYDGIAILVMEEWWDIDGLLVKTP
jgi:hypothetical protein